MTVTSSPKAPLITGGRFQFSEISETGDASSRPAGTMPSRALTRTVSMDLRNRVERTRDQDAQRVLGEYGLDIPRPDQQLDQMAHRLKIIKAERVRQLEAAQRLSEKEPMRLLRAPATSTSTALDICAQTFALEGMIALKRKTAGQNTRLADIKVIVDAIDPDCYVPLFSDDPAFAGEATVEKELNRKQAVFAAYKEVFNRLPEEDRSQIRRQVEASFALFKEELQEATDMLRETLKAIPQNDADAQQRAQRNLAQAESISRAVFCDDEKAYLLEKDNIWTKLYGILGTAPPQIVSSALHFGYGRNWVDDMVTNAPSFNDRLDAASILKRGGITGAALGGFHYVVSEAVRPLVTVLSEMAGGPVAAVDPKLIYPDPLEFTVVNGEPQPVAQTVLDARKEEVKAKRAEFKQAQAACKFGASAGDLAGYASFGAAHAIRVALQHFKNASMDSVHARAIASGIGGGVMVGMQTAAQLRQKVDGIPTHTLGTRKPFGKNALIGMAKRFNPLEEINRRELISKVGGAIEGITVASMIDAGANQRGESTTSGKGSQVAINAFSSAGTLIPFFANTSAAAEVKAAKDQNTLSSTYLPSTENAVQGLIHPGAAHVPHTARNGTAGTLENGYQVVRHGMQLLPQFIADGMEAAVSGMKYLGGLAAPKVKSVKDALFGRAEAEDDFPMPPHVERQPSPPTEEPEMEEIPAGDGTIQVWKGSQRASRLAISRRKSSDDNLGSGSLLSGSGHGRLSGSRFSPLPGSIGITRAGSLEQALQWKAQAAKKRTEIPMTALSRGGSLPIVSDSMRKRAADQLSTILTPKKQEAKADPKPGSADTAGGVGTSRRQDESSGRTSVSGGMGALRSSMERIVGSFRGQPEPEITVVQELEMKDPLHDIEQGK